MTARYGVVWRERVKHRIVISRAHYVRQVKEDANHATWISATYGVDVLDAVLRDDDEVWAVVSREVVNPYLRVLDGPEATSVNEVNLRCACSSETWSHDDVLAVARANARNTKPSVVSFGPRPRR